MNVVLLFFTVYFEHIQHSIQCISPLFLFVVFNINLLDGRKAIFFEARIHLRFSLNLVTNKFILLSSRYTFTKQGFLKNLNHVRSRNFVKFIYSS